MNRFEVVTNLYRPPVAHPGKVAVVLATGLRETSAKAMLGILSY